MHLQVEPHRVAAAIGRRDVGQLMEVRQDGIETASPSLGRKCHAAAQVPGSPQEVVEFVTNIDGKLTGAARYAMSGLSLAAAAVRRSYA